MSVRQGEENVATLFGDVHYFYGPPTDNPPHHRFDKGSYVYLFENANEGRARLEIANQPGTDAQEAFDGHLDYTHLHYSYKHTCMVSLTVDNVPNQEEWHLPTYDPTNRNMYHYKLHSLDIYFWTQKDALQFVNGIRRVMPPAQIDIEDEPGSPPRGHAGISPVVSQLEKAATSNSNDAPLFAPPPLSAVSASGTTPPKQFVPMAYNPAAPAAPETVVHREKTPPPEDGGLNPLQQAMAYDASTPFSPGLVPGHSNRGPLSPGVPPPQFHHHPGAPTFPGPPQHSANTPGLPPAGFGQHPGFIRAATMPASGTASSTYGAVTYPGSPGFAPQQVSTPPAGVQADGPPPPPGPPPGGYSQYSYSNPGATPGTGGSEQYTVHQQLYRPTEGEMAKYKPKTEPRGKMEENAGRLERGVSGMLKKFEKKFA